MSINNLRTRVDMSAGTLVQADLSTSGAQIYVDKIQESIYNKKQKFTKL